MLVWSSFDVKPDFNIETLISGDQQERKYQCTPHALREECDTPSWFFFLPSGHNDPGDPTKPGWGGRFNRELDRWYRDVPCAKEFDPRTEVSHWRTEFQQDFAERMALSR